VEMAAEPVFAAPPPPDMMPPEEPAMPMTLPEPPPEPVVPISPGYSWVPPPAAPAGWPEFATEMSSRADPPDAEPMRTFGQPVDALAQAELAHAASRETFAPFSIVSHELPMHIDEPEPVNEIAAAPVDHLAPALPPLSDADFRTGPAVEADSFAALVSAARRKSLELEPEPAPPPPKVRTSNKKFFAVLIILLIVAVVALEHQEIEKVLPASAGLFSGLGLR